METIWANENGDFILRDGFPGNPGCDCGEYDAVVKINGSYLCQAGYEELLAEIEI